MGCCYSTPGERTREQSCVDASDCRNFETATTGWSGRRSMNFIAYYLCEHSVCERNVCVADSTAMTISTAVPQIKSNYKSVATNPST